MFGVQLSRALIEEDYINFNLTKRQKPTQQQQQKKKQITTSIPFCLHFSHNHDSHALHLIFI